MNAPLAPNSAIEVDGVAVYFDNRFGQGRRVGPFSFQVEWGTICWLRGPNGSGKSTLLRCIAGLQRYHEGTLTVRPKFSVYLPQVANHVLFPWLALRDQIELFSTDPEAHRTAVTRILDRLGWPSKYDLETTTCGALSVGLRHLFAIALEIARPGVDLVLLDEPYSALHDERYDAVSQILSECASAGSTIVLSSHIKPHLAAATKIVEMPADEI
jgi:ABC-type multidrug transport system ATPase subunit